MAVQRSGVCRWRIQWPDIKIEIIDRLETLHILRWTMKISGNQLEGSLARDMVTIHLDGDVRASAVFSRWVRDQVPVDQPLLFYDEGFTADVPITTAMSAEDLAAPFMGA